MARKKVTTAAALGILIASLSSIASNAQSLTFEHVLTIGSEGDGEGQFRYVEDFAFSREGHLLVTDAAHAWVQVFDATTGAFIARFGGKGDGDENLDKPEGIAVDDDGNVYVTDYNTGFIQKYGPDYAWLQTFGGYGSELGQTMESEFMDIHDGRLYVPDAGNDRVNVFDLSGEPLFNFGELGTEPGQFETPEAAKFNSEGKLFVSDLKNDRIQVFDAEGKPLMIFGKTGAGPGELASPAGLAFDAEDNVYVTEIGNNRVQVFDKSGNFLAMWGEAGSETGQFGNLHGIIINPDTGHIYIADTANNRIQVFRRTAS